MLTRLAFLSDLPLYKTEKPYYFVENFPEVPPSSTSNCQYEKQSLSLIDLRGIEDKFTLEQNGWQYLNHKSPVSLDIDAYLGENYCQETVDRYLADCVEVVQALFKSSKLICFDWRIRKSDASDEDVKTENLLRSRQSVQTPARTMHCDYSINGGYKRMATHLIAEEFEQVNQGHTTVRFVNLWRPLKTVKSSPIVFGDPRTILREDLVEVDKISRDSVEFGFRVKNQIRPDQRWYWLSNQRPDEPVAFVSWDPKDTGLHAAYPPHGAAMDVMDENEPTRVSIEVRMMVLSRAKKMEPPNGKISWMANYRSKTLNSVYLLRH